MEEKTKDEMFEDFASPEGAEYVPSFGAESQISGDAISSSKEGIISPLNDDFIPHTMASLHDNTIAKVSIFNVQSKVAGFTCDVASSEIKQRVGLQSYNSLSRNAGLLFPYNTPRDVLYHMGTVSFPIDIIFVNAENKINKIYKNIQPGTLATFGASNIKNVLEIKGGLSSALNLKPGDKLFVDLQSKTSSSCFSRSAIYKFSKIAGSRIRTWNGFPYAKLDTIRELTASEISSAISLGDRPTSIFMLDDIISSEIPVICNSKKAISPVSSVFGEIIYNGTVVVASLKGVILNKKIANNITTLLAFMPDSSEARKLLSVFNSKAATDNIIIATTLNNHEIIKELVCKRASLLLGSNSSQYYQSVEVVKLTGNDFYKNAEHLMSKFGAGSKIITSNVTIKTAEVDIPDNIKEKSKQILPLLSKLIELLKTSNYNFKKNISAYDKLSATPEKIPQTKGQLFQSNKRNKDVVKKYLILCRDIVQKLNEIKDSSSVMSLISTLANSAKLSSKISSDIMSDIDLIEDVSFISQISNHTLQYDDVIEDFITTSTSIKDFINSNILGLTILSS